MTFLFLVPNLSFFSKNFKQNFECQVGLGVFFFFLGDRGVYNLSYGGGIVHLAGGMGGGGSYNLSFGGGLYFQLVETSATRGHED